MAPEFDREYYVSLNRYSNSRLTPEEHYDRVGWRMYADPTPWFSTKYYLDWNPDVRSADVNPFVHYLEHGRAEGRPVGPANYESGIKNASADKRSAAAERYFQSAAAEPENVSREQFDRIESAHRDTIHEPDHNELELLASAIDVSFYQKQVPSIDFSIVPAALHYASVGWRAGLDPSPDFSTTGYLAAHPDVASAGMNPLLHYIYIGHTEDREKRPSLLVHETKLRADGREEWAGYRDVKNREYSSLEDRAPDLSLLRFTFNLAGTNLVNIVKSLKLKHNSGQPLISIVIPCLGQELLTVECLSSVFAYASDAKIEILIADNASGGELFKSLSAHKDINYVGFPTNIGFGPACNGAAMKARGKYILFLNNDAQIAPHSLSAMIELFNEEPRAGVVGPRILNFDGTLQEAGALANSDGRGQLIGFGLSPNVPRFGYRRKVDYVSGAALMVRRELFEEMGGFDDVYAPAYCEDVDLCLKIRRAGYDIYYEPCAIVAHHLSKTSNAGGAGTTGKMALINRNRATLVRRWCERLEDAGMRTIAFYLPQFHPVPQNDVWWGKGFTEWTNTSKARPNFLGHRQPRLPADLGNYDLRVAEVMDQQAALARRYGVDGFCYYYYWFSGERVLEMPLERLLQTGKPDIPFCLCWANENWTRRWDGNDDDILLAQNYDEENAVSIAQDLGRYFDMSNYIRIDGRPLILIYRLQEIPNPLRFVESCRNLWRTEGKGEVVVGMVESFELSATPQDPKRFGADITVEFPAHGMVKDPPLPVTKTNPQWVGSAHDYRELASNFMTRVEPGFKRIRSVLVGWDSTPRHRDRSFVLENATPGAFQAWLEWTYRRTRVQNFGDERIVFINAWNEWAEGSYLEPDSEFGHGFLEAVRNARESITSGGEVFDD
jgi:O-antigen biosynthesis protein